MKRRHIKEARYAQDGPHGTPAKEILKRWMRRGGKRRIRRLERREAIKAIRDETS